MQILKSEINHDLVKIDNKIFSKDKKHQDQIMWKYNNKHCKSPATSSVKYFLNLTSFNIIIPHSVNHNDSNIILKHIKI